MRNRIRMLAIAVVVIGGGALANPRPAYATYSPPPQYCCCEMAGSDCISRCCSTFGCSITPTGCRTVLRPAQS